MAELIVAKTIKEAYPRIFKLIQEKGKEHQDERGQKTIEIFDLVVELTSPLEDMIPDSFPMNEEELEKYALQLLTPEKGDFSYTYGQRLLNFKGVNQLEYVKKKLKANAKSRRAVCALWDPLEDPKLDEVPCLDLIIFNIREGKLHLSATFRSNDMARAWCANAYGLARVLQYMANELNLEVGRLTTHSTSAHIYV